MIEHQGVWLPDGETALCNWMDKLGEVVDGRGTYQIKKYRAALKYCGPRRTAVDIGAHVGLWTMQMVKHFAFVHAFEPLLKHRECFHANMNGVACQMYPLVLGEQYGHVGLNEDGLKSSSQAFVVPDGELEMRSLDDCHLKTVDFIKCDCEGYDLFALRGGEKTILRDKPVIVVEQKRDQAQRYGLERLAAVDYLISLGYWVADEMEADYIMVHQ